MQNDEFWHKRCLIIFIDTQRVGRYQEIVGCKGIIKTNTLRTKREPEIHTQPRGQSKKRRTSEFSAAEPFKQAGTEC